MIFEMDNTLIRQVKVGDFDNCFRVEKESYKNPDEAASREKIGNRICAFPEGFLVAEVGGRVVGIVNSCATDLEDISGEELKDLVGHERGGKNMVIFSLAVLPEFQGRGISRLLMEKFVEVSRELGKEKILLICKDGLVDYYKKYGFAYVGKSASSHGGSEWHEMSLLLNGDESG